LKDRVPQSGFPRVKPPKKRKQKDTPSRRRADARDLAKKLEAMTSERHTAWAEGNQPNVIARTSSELRSLQKGKRVMVRGIYAAAPHLEGQPVYKGRPGG